MWFKTQLVAKFMKLNLLCIDIHLILQSLKSKPIEVKLSFQCNFFILLLVSSTQCLKTLRDPPPGGTSFSLYFRGNSGFKPDTRHLEFSWFSTMSSKLKWVSINRRIIYYYALRSFILSSKNNRRLRTVCLYAVVCTLYQY